MDVHVRDDIASPHCFPGRGGGQREHHSDESIENDSTQLSSSDSETGNTEATDTELELSDDSVCELDGISSLFDEHSGSDLSADDESQSDDDRESARSESNSDNGNTESSLSDSERADDKNKCELDGISSLFDERRGSDFSADDESDGDDDLESTKSELNIELCSSDSESTDDNTKATTTEPELSDDSLCEVDGFSSHFDQHGGSQLGDDDQLARDDGKALDNEDADVVINYDLQSCVDEDPLCL
ncbi:uncharacterized protein LOC141897706 [Acropora palmata]|uniref:uncharacterized protein LOC141897706 n=1 Tax=Acropora palmata TaxID=6131 RepID=UPI003DA07E17